MKNARKSFLLDEITLLVKHFGLQRVQAAVAKVSGEIHAETKAPARRGVSSGQKWTRPPVAKALESIHESEPEKHRLLSEFLIRLRDRNVLPESQDIRVFAQLVGLKDIQGKSRKDLIPALMYFLLPLPADTLRAEIKRADGISQQQRREGFSVLADKILGQR